MWANRLNRGRQSRRSSNAGKTDLNCKAMAALIILAAVLLLLNILVVTLYLYLAKRYPASEDDDTAYYDENGNHIYYDRKRIAHLEKEKQKTIQ